MTPRHSADFDKSIFINCPFDPQYRDLFDAAVFTVLDCGFVPRCALEMSDSGETRIEKLFKIIADCKLGVHDLSRTEPDKINKLPRFNMPLELGIFLGAKAYGNKHQKSKRCLILDQEGHRYQKFISDIAGQDISSHENSAGTLIETIRDWLITHSGSSLPGGDHIKQRYAHFNKTLPAICKKLKLTQSKLKFKDQVYVIKEWSGSIA